MTDQVQETINNRIGQVVAIAGLSRTEFSQRVEEKKYTLDNIIGPRQTKPNFELLKKIAVNFDVSMDWLVIGRGSMKGSNEDAEMMRVKVDEYRGQVDLLLKMLKDKEDKLLAASVQLEQILKEMEEKKVRGERDSYKQKDIY